MTANIVRKKRSRNTERKIEKSLPAYSKKFLVTLVVEDRKDKKKSLAKIYNVRSFFGVDHSLLEEYDEYPKIVESRVSIYREPM